MTRHYQAVLLEILGISLLGYIYGAITLYGLAFQKHLISPIRPDPSLHTTSPQRSPLGIRFGFFRFRSPLFTESLLFSFPALIRMLWFSAFPFLDRNMRAITTPIRCLIRVSSDQRLLATTRGLSQLVTPFISLQAEISPKQRGRIEF